ncbi:ribonuclease D (plasmid) [Pseudoalteromonas xiamenensis]|uniref:ribonuclease D n=1 Tax=Pseudoalteromonas xiamenensis TaxID=882626 RepID=UPI0027E401A6|nr:ribonuclease D [Pseudoalteromonas xiamenensis]WMN62112.1 ribonuclease D [Pseudoalteromonas xiamenensis]
MQYQFINSQTELDSFVSQIRSSAIIAIDTEFMRRKTLYPEIALIQVYDGNSLGVIDPLAPLEFDGLFSILQDTSVMKVIHSPSEDIEVFQKFAGFVPAPLFDTQFALLLLGHGNCVGFANMVKSLLDLEIDKSESRTNWLQRPLTQEQLDYAASDVYYLLPCFELLKPQIDARNWNEIVVEESALVARKRSERLPDDELFTDIKNAWQLKPRDLAVLKVLSKWRQNKAELKNLALSHVLKEHNMVEIAKRRPTSTTSLRNIPGVEPMEVNRYGKEILACIEQGKQIPESECPERLKRLVDFPEYKKAFKQIKHVLVEVAQKHDIPFEVLASKKQINQIISWKWKKTDELKERLLQPDLFQAWRKDYIGSKLDEWKS